MITTTITGLQVSIINNEKTHLEDSHGNRWIRDSQYDTNECVAFTKFTDPQDTILFTREELVRVCKGNSAINTPVSVEEMRDYASRTEYGPLVDGWSDQQLREILMDADERGQNPGVFMEKIASETLKKQRELEPEPEILTEATGRATEARRAPKTAQSTPRPRKQEGSVSVALEGASVLLTPKQLEFMERLSECPDWENKGPTGEYIAADYAQELSDTMNPMSVGAVLTTLREKHLLQTEKRRVGAIKCCVFKLTDLGIQVYNKLSRKESGSDV